MEQQKRDYEQAAEGNIGREYEQTKQSKQGQQSGGGDPPHMSPEETKQKVKDTVARGLAAVAGALEGFNQQVKKNDIPEQAKETVQQVGDTTRKVAETTKQETKKVKETFQGSGSDTSGGSGSPAPGGMSGSSGSSGSSLSSGGMSGMTGPDVHQEPTGRKTPEKRSPPGGAPPERRL